MSVHKKILERNGRIDQQQQQQYQQQLNDVQTKQNIEDDIVQELENNKQFNSSQYYMRCTSNVFPKSKQTYYDCKLPFAIIIQPYGLSVKQGFPQINYGSYPILRCSNCRAYVNPYMKFMDDGEYMRCNLCTLITKIPYNFYKQSDTQSRIDLTQGSYDIKAGQEYQARPPMAPAYFFMIDVSTKSEGLLPILGQVMHDLILEDKFNERTLFGFITFDTSIQVYNFNNKLKQAQMYVLTDDYNELPTPGDYLFNLQDSKDIIVAFLAQLQNLFPKPQLRSTKFIQALKLSQKIMQDNGGKLIILTTSPIKEISEYTNNKQQQQQIYIQPVNDILKQFCETMHLQFICPSIFVVPTGYNNLCTLNQLVKYLNGDIFFYDDPQIYTQKFYYEIKQVLSKDYTWEAVFRIRQSIGWKVKNTYGNFAVKNQDLLNLTCADDSKILIYELDITQQNVSSDNLYIQTALLYTATSGERRIRVHNICIPLSNSVKTIYSQIDQSALSITLFKLTLQQLQVAKDLLQVKEFIIASARAIFYNCRQYKEQLDQMYSYLLGIMKQSILNHTYNSQSILTDCANYFRCIYQYLNVDEISNYLVPQLYNLSNLQDNECMYDDSGYFMYPQPVSLVFDELINGGLFLMDCGYCLIFYICKLHNEQQIQDIFGKEYMNILLTEDHLYSNSQNAINDKIYYLISDIRSTKFSKYIPLYIVKQGSRTLWEDVFIQNLIYDDMNKSYRMNYNQFVQYIVMKKNRFQQQKEEQRKQNYFDDEEDIDIEEEGLFGKEVLIASKPYEEYFQKFNLLYNNHIQKFQAFEEDYQIPLTQPDYQSIIQSHFMVYEKNMGLFDFMKSDNQLFDKISASFVYIDNQVKQIEDQFYKYLDKLTIYGELADLHLEEERKLADGEAEIMISRMLGQFKLIYDIIKKLINYITHLVNQLNLLYNKKDPISKNIKIFNLNFPLDTIGRSLYLIYILDNVVEQNEYLLEHWNYCKRMLKIVKPDPTKFNSNQQNVKQLEKIMIRLDRTVLSGCCLTSVLSQNWDQNVHEKTGKEKSANIPAIRNNKDFFNMLNAYLKDRFDLFDKTIGTAKEMFERDLILPTFCVYALVRKLYPNEENRDLWKQYWSLQKKIPMVEGHSQVLCYLSKFLLEVTPLTKKSQTMDPKDPIQNLKNYLQKLSQQFNQQLTAQYVAFTTWIVRVDSFSCSQASFNNIEKVEREKAQKYIEEKMNQRVFLVLQGLTIASQVRNILQSLLLGHFGMEEQALDLSLSNYVVLAVEMLKAIEYYFELKYDVFQPALIQNHITKNGQRIIQQVLEKMKANLKSFGTGGAEILGALQILNGILKSTLSPLKLQTMQYLIDFLVVKDIFNQQEKEDFRIILWKLDKLILLPYYVKKVTASTYFYWCRDLLPQFFQYIYQNPSQAKRIQFLLNAVSDCSKQLQGCLHLENPDELYDSFRQFVVKEFYTNYLQPLARDIEDYLRIQVHTILIEKITALNPFKQQVKDLKRLLDIDYVLIFDSIVYLRTEINQILNETFYNINVLNMYDQETYEQMRSLANNKFGLNLINVYLPTQTVDQGNFDVLNVLKNIQQFFTKYTYNLYQQQFVQVTSESKQVYSISIQQIADSIRTHGTGILSTSVNSVYKFLQKKIQIFSQFLFDDYIQSPLVREDRFFREKKDELDGQYPFDRAEALYKEIKKLGQFEDGTNYLDKFRTLITQIGNALAFVRLLRSAALHVNSKCLEFLPSSFNSTQLEQLTRDAGFSDATVSTAKDLEEIFAQYKNSFSEKIDYIKLLLKAFAGVNSPENVHLNLFYLIIPTLTINFIEKMLISKDQIGKKNSTTEVFISDDGFILGIQFLLTLLDQKQQFDSLHWRKEIKNKFSVDMKSAKTLATTKPNQSQRATDEINMQKELSLRKLNMQYDEFQMFFYAYNSCKILFLSE